MIRLSKSVIDKDEVIAVTKVLLEDGYLGMGKEVGLFEEDIAKYIGVESCNVVCVNSGTAALHLAVQAIAKSGDEILVPSFTFLSSFQAISAAGVIPVACDIYEDTLTIDVDDALSKITPRTKAIMCVHYASNPANIEKLYNFASANKLRVIEDAAHAFGCSLNSQKIGSFGDIICFSFDGIKNITSGEGGAIITKDVEILELVKDSRLLGVIKDSEKRYSGNRSWDFDVLNQGYRYHMSNLFAAIGRVQLKKLDMFFAPSRIKFYNIYHGELKNIDDIAFQVTESNAYIIPHILPILVKRNKRDSLRDFLEKNNVQTGIHYKPNHLLSLYYKEEINLPVTDRIYNQILTLPLHPNLNVDDIYKICNLIQSFLK